MNGVSVTFYSFLERRYFEVNIRQGSLFIVIMYHSSIIIRVASNLLVFSTTIAHTKE
jgi:hypothetical protein